MGDGGQRQGRARIALAYAPELRPGGFASVDILAGSVVAPLLPAMVVAALLEGSTPVSLLSSVSGPQAQARVRARPAARRGRPTRPAAAARARC